MFGFSQGRLVAALIHVITITLWRIEFIKLIEKRLTPGITRRPEPLEVDEIIRVAGRVHAVVRRRGFIY